MECSSYNFDHSLRPGVTNIYNDEPWQTAVTEFLLLCDLNWFNALLTSMGLVGIFIGAFIAGLYTDRFGRKNAILVWSFISMAFLVAHSFMPDKYGFMICRTLGNGANVSQYELYFTV